MSMGGKARMPPAGPMARPWHAGRAAGRAASPHPFLRPSPECPAASPRACAVCSSTRTTGAGCSDCLRAQPCASDCSHRKRCAARTPRRLWHGSLHSRFRRGSRSRHEAPPFIGRTPGHRSRAFARLTPIRPITTSSNSVSSVTDSSTDSCRSLHESTMARQSFQAAHGLNRKTALAIRVVKQGHAGPTTVHVLPVVIHGVPRHDHDHRRRPPPWRFDSAGLSPGHPIV